MATEGKIITYPNESFSGCDMVATVLMNVDGKQIAHTLGELMSISYSIHQDRKPVRSIGNINAKDYVMGPRTIAGSLIFTVFNKHVFTAIMDKLGDSSYSYLIDEFPPFNIVVSFANEYGLRSRLVIYGVRLVNEGQVMSINDVYTENSYQFVASDLEYMKDDNSLTSSGDHKGRYVIEEKESVSYTLDGDSYTTSLTALNNSVNIYRVLRHDIKNHQTGSKTGLVDLWVYPLLREEEDTDNSSKFGYITITSSSESKVIKVYDNMNGAGTVRVPLEAGPYTAKWSNGKESTPEINFVVLDETDKDVRANAAPSIEYVSSNYAVIHCNTINHKYITVEDVKSGTVFIRRKLIDRRLRAEGLFENREYVVYTHDYNENTAVVSNVSNRSEFKTLNLKIDEFADFLDYLSYNKKKLNNNNFSIYINVNNKAKNIYLVKGIFNSLSDCYDEAKSEYIKELNDLKIVDFPNANEFEKARTEKKEHINAAVEILFILYTIVNDEVYGYNYDTKVVKEPAIIRTRPMTALLVSDSVESLEFFRMTSNSVHYEKSINKKMFVSEEDGMVCNFAGRQNTKYMVYAINEHGFRSPKVEFFVGDNDTNIEMANKESVSTSDIKYKLKSIQFEVGGINESLTDEERMRIYLEILYSNSLKIVTAPKIVDVTDKTISLSIDEYDTIELCGGGFVSIASADDIMKNKPTYKIPVNNLVEFDYINHGIKKDGTYLIWIEDNNENIISESISVKVSNDESNSIIPISYFTESIMDKIEYYYKSKKITDNTLMYIINKNKYDRTLTKSSIMNSLLDDILFNVGSIIDVRNTILNYYKFHFDNSYTISNDFIDAVFELDFSSKSITSDETCIVSVTNISQSEVISSVDLMIPKSSKQINCSGTYTLICFIDTKLASRSGFIFIDNFNNTYSVHSINVKVGE